MVKYPTFKKTVVAGLQPVVEAGFRLKRLSGNTSTLVLARPIQEDPSIACYLLCEYKPGYEGVTHPGWTLSIVRVSKDNDWSGGLRTPLGAELPVLLWRIYQHVVPGIEMGGWAIRSRDDLVAQLDPLPRLIMDFAIPWIENPQSTMEAILERKPWPWSDANNILSRLINQ